MIYLLLVLLLLSGYGIVHTYLVFPWLCWKNETKALESQQRVDQRKYKLPKQDWPEVALLMAVHNEEFVLRQKLDASLRQDYPGELRLYIGCDNCTDDSWPILEDYMQRYPKRVFASKNPRRMGKPKTINRLYAALDQDDQHSVLWLTDASVIPANDCLGELVRPLLADPTIVLVDAQQLHTGIEADGISRSEDSYINREARLKQAESRKYGYLIGPFGGCYVLRAEYFSSVPDNFLVDDFYLCMAAYEKGGRGISAPRARAYEGVGQQLGDEFRRKVRIASGNWQNLIRFRRLWWPPIKSLNFAFFSHKVLRWWTPFLALLFISCLSLLAFQFGNYWAQLALYGIILVVVLPVSLDLILRLMGKHYLLLRNWRYFIAMNLALLLGFFRYLKGVKTNVWQPSKRH
ncbi:MAG: glycosyltransferase [Bacteroidota bacterium]